MLTHSYLRTNFIIPNYCLQPTAHLTPHIYTLHLTRVTDKATIDDFVDKNLRAASVNCEKSLITMM